MADLGGASRRLVPDRLLINIVGVGSVISGRRGEREGIVLGVRRSRIIMESVGMSRHHPWRGINGEARCRISRRSHHVSKRGSKKLGLIGI